MAVFEFRAVDASGNRITGTLVGRTPSEATENLRQRGLQVEHLSPAQTAYDPLEPAASPRPDSPAAPRLEGQTSPAGKSRAAQAQTALGVSGVSNADLMFFFRQFAAMIRAGVPLVQSLTTLSGQARNGKLKRILLEAAEGVRQGMPLTDTFGRYPEVFNPLVLSLIRAGEQGGFLERATQDVAAYLEREIELRNMYRRATIYPKLQIGAAILIIGAANGILGAVGGGAIDAPLNRLSTWVVLGPILAVVLWFWFYGRRMPAFRRYWDAVIVNIPYLGGIYRKMAMARFGRAFGALFAGGVLIPEALRLSAAACGNLHMQERILPAAADLERGVGVTEAFAKTGAFTPVVLDMTATGEQSGMLAPMLEKVAEYYEDETKTQQYNLAKVTGVVAFLIVAVYIGYVVLSFWGGYAQQLQSIGDL